MKKELIKNMVSLIVGEALLEFIENPTSPNIVNDLREKYSEKILSAIDSMQEEPVNEELEEAGKEWLRPQLDKTYANYGEVKMMELTHFDGYAMLDAIEFGANWQKEQLLAKAVDAVVKVDACGYPYVDRTIELYDYDKDIPLAKRGDKVKILVIKEE